MEKSKLNFVMKIDARDFYKPYVMNRIKIIQVDLNTPYKGESRYFFGSIAAIYDVLSPDEVGATLHTLYKKLRSNNRHVVTRKATITTCVMYRKKTNRGKKKGAEA